MTAEEQASYDPIITEGRSVADAVKADRHDQEVFAIAKELSDKRHRWPVRRLDRFAHRGQVTPTQLQGPGDQGAGTPLAVVGQEMRANPMALGPPALSLRDVIPVTAHAQLAGDPPDRLGVGVELALSSANAI